MKADHIDHTAKAVNAIDSGWMLETEEAHTRAAFLIAEAQVHATLALAEQLRIANLIAVQANPGLHITPDIAAALKIGDPS